MREESAQDALSNLTSWTLPELLDAARSLTRELVGRSADPSLVDHLPRFPRNPPLHPSDEWGLYTDDVPGEELAELTIDEIYAQNPVGEPAPQGTLPELHEGVEALGRSVDAVRTALAGHTARIFDQPSVRHDVLGIPEGKCGYRNAIEYLRDRLRISRRDATTRIERSQQVLATRTLDLTQTVPARWPVLTRAAAAGELDLAAVDIIVATLAEARNESTEASVAPAMVDQLLVEGERSLVSSARELDPDALGKVCAHWRVRFDALVDPDGMEPADALRRAGQGLFYRGRRDGLHRWSLIAADGQHEILKTITAAASSIRSGHRSGDHADGPADACTAELLDDAPGNSTPVRTADSTENGVGRRTADGASPFDRWRLASPTDDEAAPPHPHSAASPTSPPPAPRDAQGAMPRVDSSSPTVPDRPSLPTAFSSAELSGPARPSADHEIAGRDEERDGIGAGEDAVRCPTDVDDAMACCEACVAAGLESDRPGGCPPAQDIMEFEALRASLNPSSVWARQVRAAQAAEMREATDRAAVHVAAAAEIAVGWDTHVDESDPTEERSKGQRELDGLISALSGALALTSGGDTPDGGGGARPQVLVTIDYQTLLEHTFRPTTDLPSHRHPGSVPERCPEPCCDSSLESRPLAGEITAPGAEPTPGVEPPEPALDAMPPALHRTLGPGPETEWAPPWTPPRGRSLSSASYAGQIGPATIRAWACDAELIPVVLGGAGEVLDVGRSRRLFTRALRRAITARDGGCTVPGCTIPAPWCEAHHVEHWEHGGPTSVDNGVLLCSHHHHAVHSGAWTISMRRGIPWYIPAAYHDPRQRPRRNTVWRPDAA